MPIKRKKTRKKPVEKPEKKEDLFMATVKTVTSIPTGFISFPEFATRAGVSLGAITQARNAGKFSPQFIRLVRFPGKRPMIYLHWEGLGPAYIRSRPRAKWPEWFQKQESENSLEDPGTMANGESTGVAGSTMTTVVVKDIHSAKLRSEQLKIQKQELELQQAQNMVIDLEEVAGILYATARAIMQALRGLGPRVGPLVAAESTALGCTRIISEEAEKVGEELQILKDFATEAGIKWDE